MKYNPWPLGHIPKELQRQEPYIIREMGYEWEDPRDIVDIFERKVAEFAGSKYAVAVDSCSHALFLALEYYKYYNNIKNQRQCEPLLIPLHTYCSVPQQIRNAGFSYEFINSEWSGIYQIRRTRVWDAALRWTDGMFFSTSTFTTDHLMCLSFQIKKRIPIGKGGMILCNSKEEYDWLKLARHDGRDLDTPYDDPNHVKMNGWHCYMTPEDAARGIILMDNTPRVNKDQGGWQNYPPLK